MCRGVGINASTLLYQDMRKIVFGLIIFALIQASCSKQEPYVIMLSMDAFRWDYTSLTETPNFDRISDTGVKAASLKPVYPSKTFPNHYSIATGLHPDHHGIVQNNFYDPDLDRSFTISNREAVQDSIFWGGEPIWSTAEKQGIPSASYFWVGTESNATYRPGRNKLYDHDFPFIQRIDSVISWLYLPIEERPRLIMFYFHEPDGVGHDFGPESEETLAEVRRLDSLLGVFLDKLEQAELNLNLSINFIVTSDHGMGYIPPNQTVLLDTILNMDRIERVNGSNPVYLLQPETEYVDSCYQILLATEHLKVWKKAALPGSYHYGTHSRIYDLVVEAEQNWGLSFTRRSGIYSRGTHGYDPDNTDMHGIFYARGPAFKEEYIHNTFQNISIYPLIAHIMELNPAPVDGDFEAVKGMLRNYQ